MGLKNGVVSLLGINKLSIKLQIYTFGINNEGAKSMKEHSLWLAIKQVLEDTGATNEEKLERIETYIEVHELNNKPSMSDMD